MNHPKLDITTLCIVENSDTVFTSNTDVTSQLGRKVLLADGCGFDAQISFKTYKSRHAICSVLTAELIGFEDLFGEAFALRSQIEQALRRTLPLH